MIYLETERLVTGLERRGFGCFFSNESGSQGDGIFSETTDRHRKPGFL